MSCILASGAIKDASVIPENSPRGAAKISSLTETIGQEQTDFPASAKFLVATQSTTPKVNLQAVPMMGRSENDGKVALHDSELCLEMA